MVWCQGCAAWSGGLYRALRQRCTNQLTALGRFNLRRLRMGLAPLGAANPTRQEDQPTRLIVMGIDSESDEEVDKQANEGDLTHAQMWAVLEADLFRIFGQHFSPGTGDGLLQAELDAIFATATEA